MQPPASCPKCGEAGCCIRHGTYPRKGIDADGEVRDLQVFRFLCKNEKCDVSTISYLPSFLVPHKHYQAYVIEELFLLILYRGISAQQAYRQKLNACLKTIYIWLGQYRRQLVILRQDGFKRSGIPPPEDNTPAAHFSAVINHYRQNPGDTGILEHFQTDLCSEYPFIGMFKPLLSGSQS